MSRSYEILPRAAAVGGGWRLRLLENGKEVGGEVFSADPTAAVCTSAAWWKCQHEDERAKWAKEAGTASVDDAFSAYLSFDGHCIAETLGENWVLELP
ncbi:hypothetical protein [Burkholderia ambifaria]|uniref:hypothetical protein n=1 Tax=Burkholderia ambifaria TaxID=152480 RepID=UPI00158B7C94|nr:hypothetical protein [Burkholderia ambifaria]